MALSIKETVWDELIDRLKGITYVKEIIEGNRQYNLDGKLPAIRVDIAPGEEQWQSFPKQRSGELNVMIYGAIDVRGNRLDRQIIGDNVQVGILRFEEDILKALEGSDIRFNNNVNNYQVQVLDNRIVNDVIREVVISVRFQLKHFTAQSRT